MKVKNTSLKLVQKLSSFVYTIKVLICYAAGFAFRMAQSLWTLVPKIFTMIQHPRSTYRQGRMQHMFGMLLGSPNCFWRMTNYPPLSERLSVNIWSLKSLSLSCLQISPVLLGEQWNEAHDWSCRILHQEPDQEYHFPHAIILHCLEVNTDWIQGELWSVTGDHSSLLPAVRSMKFYRHAEASEWVSQLF